MCSCCVYATYGSADRLCASTDRPTNPCTTYTHTHHTAKTTQQRNNATQVSAVEKNSGKSQTITITSEKGRLSEDEIERMVRFCFSCLYMRVDRRFVLEVPPPVRSAHGPAESHNAQRIDPVH